MSYAIIESYTNTTATVRIKGLEHPARKYDEFKIYLESTPMGRQNPVSYSPTDEAYVTFDLSQTADGRITANGVYYAHIYAVWKGVEYEVPISGSSRIEIDKGGGYPPTPRNHRLTSLDILDFSIMEDDHVEIKVRTDGYGEVYLMSVTKAWNLYTGEKNSRFVHVATCNIREDLLDDGMFQGWVVFYPNATDMSTFPAVPTGTCHLEYDGKYSRPFICMSQYAKWAYYAGTYSTTLKYNNGSLYAGVDYLSTVKQDWTRLVNMSFYLEATTWGDIKYAQYNRYIPQYGDIITADMYNSLLDDVARCCRRIDYPTNRLPSHVEKGQIIPKDFIYDIGNVIDGCLITQRNNVNR